MIAECDPEIVRIGGDVAGVAEAEPENECLRGYSRYRDSVTQSLGLLASTWESLHKAAQAAQSRSEYGAPHTQLFLVGSYEQLKAMREAVGRALAKELRKHVLWSWLDGRKGVQGPTVARIISMIGDPLRFPGRHCANGHHLPSDWAGPCGIPLLSGGGGGGDDDDGDDEKECPPCGAVVGEVRRGTGVRSLWHFAGLHVVDGKAARRRKGVQCTWRPSLRVALIAKDGVADQIVKHRPEPWRTVYDETKERVARERGEVTHEIDSLIENLSAQGVGGGSAIGSEVDALRGSFSPSLSQRERGANLRLRSKVELGTPLSCCSGDGVVSRAEIEKETGSTSNGLGAGVGSSSENGGTRGLRPFQIDNIAKTVAVKAFLGDLLMEWKRRVGVEG